MQNIKSIIINYNMIVLNNTIEIEESCNCRNRNNCPLYGEFLRPNIIYEAQNLLNQPSYKEKNLLRNRGNSFQTDLTISQNHSTSNTKKSTRNYLKNWTIKQNHFTSKVTWRIIRKCAPFNTTKRKYYLCLNEQLE